MPDRSDEDRRDPDAERTHGGIDVQDRCDVASFTAAGIDCARSEGDGGGSVAIDHLFATVAAKHEHPNWRFEEEKVTLRQGRR